jgi:hypothetical protein
MGNENSLCCPSGGPGKEIGVLGDGAEKKRASFSSQSPDLATDVTEVYESTDPGRGTPGFQDGVQASTMPESLSKMVRDVFSKMDADGGGTIEVDEAQKFFSKSAFSKVSAKAMMDAMDKDSSQSLSIEEWMEYFEKLWASKLYDEDEMEEEIQGMLEGQPFTLASRLQAGGGRVTEVGKSHKSVT